jgi:hypothetical protein
MGSTPAQRSKAGHLTQVLIAQACDLAESVFAPFRCRPYTSATVKLLSTPEICAAKCAAIESPPEIQNISVGGQFRSLRCEASRQHDRPALAGAPTGAALGPGQGSRA